MEFRRGNDSAAWHFCQNCSGWPENDYDEATREPKADLCPECTRRLTDLTCETGPEEGIS